MLSAPLNQKLLERCLREMGRRTYGREPTSCEIHAAIAAVGARELSPREELRNESLARKRLIVAKLNELEKQGKCTPSAISKLVRDYARADDPIDAESLARQVRRWLKKIRTCPVEAHDAG